MVDCSLQQQLLQEQGGDPFFAAHVALAGLPEVLELFSRLRPWTTAERLMLPFSKLFSSVGYGLQFSRLSSLALCAERSWTGGEIMH